MHALINNSSAAWRWSPPGGEARPSRVPARPRRRVHPAMPHCDVTTSLVSLEDAEAAATAHRVTPEAAQMWGPDAPASLRAWRQAAREGRGRPAWPSLPALPNAPSLEGHKWPPEAVKAGVAAGAGLTLALGLFAALRLLAAGRRARRPSVRDSVEEEVQQQLRGLEEEVTAKTASLAGKGLGDAELAAVAALLLGAGSKCRAVDLRNNRLGCASAVLLSGLLPGSRLERLLLGGNAGLGDEGAALLAKALNPGWLGRGSRLKALDLSGCDIGDAGAAALAGMLARNRHLEELDLSNNLIDVRGAAALAEALQRAPALRVLRLGKNYVQAEGAAALGRALQKMDRGLQELCLESNELGDDGVAAVCAGLKHHGRELAGLDLSDNGCGPKGCQALVALLQGCTALRALCLRGNHLGDACSAQLAAAVRAKRRLKRLDLAGCGVGLEGARALAGALAGNKSLRVLQLSSNPLGPEGAEAVANAVKKPPMAVEVVELRKCGIGSGGAAPVLALFDLLRSAPSLLVLDLRDNDFCEQERRKLQSWGMPQRLAQLEGGQRAAPDLCMLLLTPPTSGGGSNQAGSRD